MQNYLKGATIALLLSGTALVCASASADDYYHNDRANSTISVQFGNVSMGYRDGYYDNDHNWHRWDSDNDYRVYRYQHADTYRDWDHDRDANNATVSVSFGDVSVGYRDGYWDNERRWHSWRNDDDYRAYRYQHGSNYHDWNHDRDGGSTVTIGFSDVAFGYRDGYWDNRHHWHHWRHRRDYRAYRDQDGSNYRDMNHDRDDNNGWQRH